MGGAARRSRAVGVATPARAAARARRSPASACSTSAAAPAASSPRCATPAPTPSAWSSPRRALERARRNVPGADLRLVAPDGSLPLGPRRGRPRVVLGGARARARHRRVPHRDPARAAAAAAGCCVTVPDHGRFKRTLIALAHYDAHYDPLGQHVRFYTRRSLTRALRATGFEDVELGRWAARRCCAGRSSPARSGASGRERRRPGRSRGSPRGSPTVDAGLRGSRK